MGAEAAPTGAASVRVQMKEAKPIQQMTLGEFESSFPDEEACCAYLVARRWSGGVRCPRCGSQRVRASMSMALKWRCLGCGRGGEYRFSHITGTFFENTKVPLRTWFRVLHAALWAQQSQSHSDYIPLLDVQKQVRFLPCYVVRRLCNRLNTATDGAEFRELMGMTLEPLLIKSAPSVRGRNANGVGSPYRYRNGLAIALMDPS